MEKVHKLDVAVIGFSMISLLFLFGYVQPLVIAPIDGYESLEGGVLFSIEKAERLVIDDNLEFSSPEEYLIRDGLKIRLEPGVYYWRAVGLVNSEIRKFTIKSLIDLRIREVSAGTFDLVNDGNVEINVDVYENGEIVEKLSLDSKKSREIKGNKFVGGMK